MSIRLLSLERQENSPWFICAESRYFISGQCLGSSRTQRRMTAWFPSIAPVSSGLLSTYTKVNCKVNERRLSEIKTHKKGWPIFSHLDFTAAICTLQLIAQPKQVRAELRDSQSGNQSDALLNFVTSHILALTSCSNHGEFSCLSSNGRWMVLWEIHWFFGFEITCTFYFRSSVALRLYHEFSDETGWRVRGHISQVRWV